MNDDELIDFISELEDFNCAPSWDTCLNHPAIPAVGVLYFWCGNPECCWPPAYYLCKECLIKQYKEERS